MRKLTWLVVLLFAACGSPEEAAEPLVTPTAPAENPAIEECEARTPPAPPTEETIDPDDEPEIEVPDGAPPCELIIQDIHEGSGAEVKEGAAVTVNYTGVSWSTGEKFDSSWDRGQAATFPLGQVVQGWQEGIPGMKEGGRRQLIIPPDLGYGPAGRPPQIAPNETLIFIIDLIEADAS